MSEETKTDTTNVAETVETQPSPMNALWDMIKEKPGAPNIVQLESWKKQYGSVYTSGFSEDELYVWRPIMRHEYREMQIKSQAIAVQGQEDPNAAIKAQMELEDGIVAMCMLWPKVTASELSNNGKAGTVATLLEQLMQNSNFMSPQQAGMLVVKL